MKNTRNFMRFLGELYEKTAFNVSMTRDCETDCGYDTLRRIMHDSRALIEMASSYGCMADHREEYGKYYPFIAYSSVCQVIEIFEKISKITNGRGRFLDAGCGIGNILLLARQAGVCSDYTGIEKFNRELNAGINFIGGNKRDIRIMKGDIVTFKNYSEYDVIYSYIPIYSDQLARVFIENVVNSAKPGAILILLGFGMHYNTIESVGGKDLEKVTGESIYIKR